MERNPEKKEVIIALMKNQRTYGSVGILEVIHLQKNLDTKRITF